MKQFTVTTTLKLPDYYTNKMVIEFFKNTLGITIDSIDVWHLDPTLEKEKEKLGLNDEIHLSEG